MFRCRLRCLRHRSRGRASIPRLPLWFASVSFIQSADSPLQRKGAQVMLSVRMMRTEALDVGR